MLWLGLLAIAQVVWLPGYIFLKYFNIQGQSRIQLLVYSFGLSLLINYLTVFFLTLCGLYQPFYIYLILLSEVAYLFVIWQPLAKKQSKHIVVSNDANKQELSLFLSPLFIAAEITFIVYGIYVYLNLGKIFTSWDVNFSVNRWAIDWFRNSWPAFTYHYPQLIPANWSLIYVITREAGIHFFARAIMPFFPLAVLLMFFDLARQYKKSVYFLALILFGVIFRFYSDPLFISNAYVDIPVAFFGLLTWYALIAAEKQDLRQKPVFLVIIFAAASAVTKQAGLYMLVIVTIWFIYTLVKTKIILGRVGVLKAAVLYIVLIGTVVIPWYWLKQIDIQKGVDISEVYPVTHSVHGDRKGLARIGYGLNLLSNGSQTPDLGVKGTKIFFYFTSFLLMLSLCTRHGRWISLGMILPFSLIWGLYLSYSLRNLNFIYPFVALGAAYGLSFLGEKILHLPVLLNYLISLAGRYRPGKLFFQFVLGFMIGVPLFYFIMPGTLTLKWLSLIIYGSLFVALHIFLFNYAKTIRFKQSIIFILIPVLALVIFFNRKYSHATLLQQQSRQQKQLGNAIVNNLLYDYVRQNGINGKILSDYWWLTVLPGFQEDINTVCPFAKTRDEELISTRNPKVTIVNPPALLKDNIDADTQYLLLTYSYDLGPIISRRLEQGEYQLIFKTNGYRFIKLGR